MSLALKKSTNGKLAIPLPSDIQYAATSDLAKLYD